MVNVMLCHAYTGSSNPNARYLRFLRKRDQLEPVGFAGYYNLLWC